VRALRERVEADSTCGGRQWEVGGRQQGGGDRQQDGRRDREWGGHGAERIGERR